MSDKKMPADWAIEKALKLREFDDGHCFCLDDVKKDPSIFVTAIAFARYIEAHETPPISRELLCAREAAAIWHTSLGDERQAQRCRVGLVDHELWAYLKFHELYASGFGETDG